MSQRSGTAKEYSFPQKVWIVGSVFALIVIVVLLLKATFNVLLLLLAGVLIAAYFKGLAGLIQRKTKWKSWVSMLLSFLLTIIILAGIFWLIGSKLTEQVSQLSDQFPSTIDNAKNQLNQHPLGQKVVDRLSSPEAEEKARQLAKTFFQSTFGVLGDIYIILFLGILFLAGAETYKKGIIKMVPEDGQDKARVVIEKLGHNLTKWLKGKLFAMLIVFVLTAIGLFIIGVPMWLALALIAGILNFIPNFGPMIALVPAVLIGLMQGPATAAIVFGLYIVVQVVESSFITPQIQKKLVEIPPAMIIIAQLIMGVLTGGIGLLLATPLMLIIIVLVKSLYIEPREKK